ncbi:isocitrate lyase/phosphoenolpyruvate mutase family protein, partial [Streptomyces sp. SID9124]|nr:isocitrate lyase/phosphoenolpyruvate mutase family protein [Streptomyces sp. SID9124]
RALVEAELARLAPADLHRAASAADRGGDLRTRVVCALATALDMPEPERIAREVARVADTYFGGDGGPDADRAVARLVATLAP